MNSAIVIATVDEILSLYIKFGENDYIGEPVSRKT